MTISLLSLLIQALLAGCATIFGLWVRHVVNQQLALKNATIENLKTQIDGMKSETAPAVLQRYQTLVSHTNEIEAERQALVQQLQQLEAQARNDKDIQPAVRLMSEAMGFYLARQDILRAVALAKYAQKETKDEFSIHLLSEVMDVVVALDDEIVTRFDKADLITAPKGLPRVYSKLAAELRNRSAHALIEHPSVTHVVSSAIEEPS